MFEITTRSISTTLIQDGNTSSMMFRNQHQVLTSSISSMMSSTSYHVLQVFPVDFGCALQLSPTDTPPENSKIKSKINQVENSTSLIKREIKDAITPIPLSEEYTFYD